MEFPKDHYFHFGEYSGEWIYLWGKLDTGDFFHFTDQLFSFGKNRNRIIHRSLNGKFHEEADTWKSRIKSTGGYANGKFFMRTPGLELVFEPKSKPVIHQTKMERRNYYSIPYLEGEGFLDTQKVKAKAWLDHEFSDIRKVPDWDWVSLHLNCGIYIMVWNCEAEPTCDVTVGDKTIESGFILEGKHLFLNDLGMYLILEPVWEEKVFNPEFAIFPYSETAFNVISKGGIIGYGLRERTYRKREKNERTN